MPEVSNLSKLGFWLVLEDEELFVAFEDFPWFREATIAEVAYVEQRSP